MVAINMPDVMLILSTFRGIMNMVSDLDPEGWGVHTLSLFNLPTPLPPLNTHTQN